MTSFYWWNIEWSRKSEIEDLDSESRDIMQIDVAPMGMRVRVISGTW